MYLFLHPAAYTFPLKCPAGFAYLAVCLLWQQDRQRNSTSPGISCTPCLPNSSILFAISFINIENKVRLNIHPCFKPFSKSNSSVVYWYILTKALTDLCMHIIALVKCSESPFFCKTSSSRNIVQNQIDKKQKQKKTTTTTCSFPSFFTQVELCHCIQSEYMICRTISLSKTCLWFNNFFTVICPAVQSVT